MKIYDHVIVGTGQALGTLLARLVETGDSIAVVEGHKVGGSCVNYGCTPTKTLVASARAMHQARRGEELGFSAGEVTVDFARVRERMNEIRNGSSEGLEKWMESTDNVDLLRGWARFVELAEREEEPEQNDGDEDDGHDDGVHALRIGEELTIGGRTVYLNVGTRAAAPPIEGLSEVEWLDSEGLLAVETLPEHLLVVGGGYVGVEMAQVFRRFGSAVTIFQRGDEIMPREDEDVSQAIRSFLEEEGIEVLCGAEATEVSASGDGVVLEVKRNGDRETHEGSHLLVATGRRPNSDRLDLEVPGIDVNERGYVVVDEVCRTRADGVYALGDVNGEGAFTHTAVNDAEIVLDHLFGGDLAKDRELDDRVPVHALFTDPPLGRAGMTEREARESGRRVAKATRAMSRISRAKEMGETTGFAKILVDVESEEFLGAAVLGPAGDEIANLFAALMTGGITWREFRRTVLIHPTVGELMPWTLDDLEELD